MIISILGTSGAFFDSKECLPQRDDEGNIKFQSAKYDSELLGKESGNYKNSTEFLLESFDDDFVFIGTKCAINFQKIILADSIKKKRVIYEIVEDDSLDDIFEKILSLIQSSDKILLDITHGFRHQPIMAIFASTLSQFLDGRDLKIIFAKEINQFEEYRYIYLNEYIEITQISLLLTGFIRTLNFIPVTNMSFLDNKVFEDFSKSLLSNDILGVERNYLLLKDELKRLQDNQELKHISTLIIKAQKELKSLDMLPFFEAYQKYMVLSKLMIEKNYLIVSLAYIFEALREYCSYRFRDVCRDIKFKDEYERNDNVMKTIGNFKPQNKILSRNHALYNKNKKTFTRVNELYNRIRKRRNALAHINQTKNFVSIKEDLNQIIIDVEQLFNQEVLKSIYL